MSQTKISNLVNPEVMADIISAGLPTKIKFAPLAKIDSTLVARPGNTITVPKFAYIGDAEDVAEGIAMNTVVLTATSTEATVKKVGKSVEITDEVASDLFKMSIAKTQEKRMKKNNVLADSPVC